MKIPFKKLSILVLFFIFISMFITITYVKHSTEESKQTEAKNHVFYGPLQQDSYDDLTKRITELEELKADEINDNLLEYYDGIKTYKETWLSLFIGIVGVISAAALTLACFIVGVNFVESKRTIEKAEEASIKAEETNEKAEAKIATLDTKIAEYEEKLDIAEKRLDLYPKILAAQSSSDFYLSIELYNEVISELEQFDMNNLYLYYSRGNAYLSKFMSLTGFKDKGKNSFFDAVRMLDFLDSHQYLISASDSLLDYAIKDFKKSLGGNSGDALYAETEVKIIDCLIYKGTHEEAFKTLQGINDNAHSFITVTALIIIKPHLYESFLPYRNDNVSFSRILSDIHMHKGYMFKRIFQSDIFNEYPDMVKDNKAEDEDALKKYRLDKYNELKKQLKQACEISESCESNNFSSLSMYLLDILFDFDTCEENATKEDYNLDEIEFRVISKECGQFLIDLDEKQFGALKKFLEEFNESKYSEIYQY